MPFWVLFLIVRMWTYQLKNSNDYNGNQDDDENDDHEWLDYFPMEHNWVERLGLSHIFFPISSLYISDYGDQYL